ncbi:hypothetical protein ACQKP8_26490 [Photobacterium alginatilyticum]|uniref:hypothetical protein n=1 Tax=Photobacterium alginatilyticum TaxID=1775171 RepID=UPI004067EB37
MPFSTQQVLAFLVVIFGGGFVIFSLVKAKKLPGLAEIFSVVLSIGGGYSGGGLCYQAAFGTKNFGDFADDKLVIALGGFGVFWVSLITIIDLFKRILERAEHGVPEQQDLAPEPE